MQVKDELFRKGALRMRALAEDINRCAEKCASVAGSVMPGEMVQFEDFDPIVNEVDRALWAIRTLDNEVYCASGGPDYVDLRGTTPRGQVVWAFASLRDVATHRADVVDPDIRRAVGPLDEGRFMIFPRWKQRTALPVDTFRKQDGGVYGTRISAYDDHVAGRHVLDTLIDAFAFFDACDGQLARRDPDGQVEGFPLRPLSGRGVGYYRLGPDWPTHEEAERNLFQFAASARPAGSARSIVGTLQAGTTICGWTEFETRRASFTEPVRQVVADISRGYPYVLAAGGSPVETVGDQLVTADGRVLSDAVPDVETSNDASWMDWWIDVGLNADLYLRQRKGI